MSTSDATLALITRAIALPKKVSIDLSQLHELNPERYPFLLESVAKGELGEFDILFAYPQETIQLNALNGQSEFLNQVASDFKRLKVDASLNEAKLPFTGGWFAYFSYDYAQVVEPVLNLPTSKFPLAVLTRIPAAVIVKHATQELFVMAEPEYREVLDQMASDIKKLASFHFSPPPIKTTHATEEPSEKYLQGIQAIKEYILSGDIFQVNLSRQWQVLLEKNVDALAVYRALRTHNPAPFAALANFKDPDGQPWHIISSSPERLVKYQSSSAWVEARPIAGTRKRSADIKADQALMTELIAHPKERAEHIMLIDLVRNDLGRICQYGTVEVNELMVVETYEHVHHIVSNIRGKLQDGLSPLDILHAMFPGGTITGCPKIRCMEIIAELEQMPREAYTGSLGYINRDGSLDLNILIRTMIQFEQDDIPTVQFKAGGGIVADSIAEHELKEAGYKAKGLINALS